MSFQSDALANAESWISWIERQALNFSDPRQTQTHSAPSAQELALFGLLTQASAESPEDFSRMFEPILGADRVNPLRSIDVDTLWNVIRNGINDDWEIFLQWREDGYRVVPEALRQDADPRFGVSQAYRVLAILTGGSRAAPGLADEAEILQHMFESESPSAPRIKSRR